jgi:acyl carrier protein
MSGGGLEALEKELVRLIVEALSLRDVDPESIDATTPLFAGGLGLDSVDILELGVVLDERYGIRIKSDDEGHKKAFETIGTLARLVEQERTEA